MWPSIIRTKKSVTRSNTALNLVGRSSEVQATAMARFAAFRVIDRGVRCESRRRHRIPATMRVVSSAISIVALTSTKEMNRDLEIYGPRQESGVVQ